MSLLTQQTQPSDAQLLQRRVQEIKSAPRKLTEMMYQQWEQSFNALWTTGKFTPAQKLEELGTDAAELFELNSIFVTFMITQLTGKRDDLVQSIQEKVATIPEHTINEDGTVTLD
jgi:hypothetical protein